MAGLVSQNATEKYSILLDLGTNGEIVLFNEKKILACSTAMGPAFEGVGIECGMSAVTGAITEVYSQKNGYAYSFLGDSPKGLCGSGIISFTSLLLSQKIIDETGHMNCDKIFVCDNVYLSSKDVRQIQLAKAAVAAGIETMLETKGISPSEINKVYLAGGFGNSIKPKDLKAISLLPNALYDKAIRVGNTSAKGCIMILLNSACRQKAQVISATAKFIDLGISVKFKDLFIEKIMF